MRSIILDFLVVLKTVDGKQVKKIIEVKPVKESVLEAAKTKKDKLAVIVNQSKWAAAKKFAQDNGMEFEIITEIQLFGKS